MTVFFAAGIILLLYIGAVPVKFALIVHICGRPAFGAGFSVFEGRYALKSARARALGEKKHLPWRRDSIKIEKTRALRSLLPAARCLLRRTRLEQLRAGGSIALSDAARTALICGGAGSLQAALSPLLPGRIQLNLQPDFSAVHSDAMISCIVSARAGHIILAMLLGAWHYLIRSKKYGKASD